MRNLKRAVSMALASIMLMGTLVVGSSAAGFSDADSITNTDAVTVVSALEVMIGRDTGEFDPTAVVTRAEMAAILCRVMYGADVATSTYDGAATFPDTVDHWASSYIGMAAAEGWVVGHDDGTFTPDATVTTAQAAIMMQRALGYFDSKDDTVDDANYILDAIRLGNKIDLFDGISVGATAGLSRDDVAAMTYNMMFNTMRVAYSTMTGIYYAVDVDSPSITSPSVAVEDDKTIAALVFDVTIEADVDMMGRPVKNVIVDKETLATTSIDYTAIFVDAFELDEVTKNMETEITDGVNLLLNGVLVDADKVFDGDDELIAGTVVEVYDDYDVDGNKTGDDTVYVAYTYNYGEITKVEYDEDDDETTVRIASKSYTLEGETSFEKGDMVMFTASGTELETLTDVITVEGEVTGVSTSFVKLDGTTYDYVGTSLLSANQLGDTYALYLTPYGYVLGVEEIEDSGVNANYLYVVDAETYFGTVRAKVVFADGTEAIIEIDQVDDNDSSSLNDSADGALVFDANSPADSVYSYKITSGEYRLYTETGVAAADGAYISNGYISTVDEDGKHISGFLSFDDETLFVDVEDGTTYIGYEAVPSYNAFAAGDLFYVDNVVFMIGGEADNSDSGIFVYIEDSGMYTTKIDGDTYYVYTDAYLDGELVKNGLYSEVDSMTAGNLYEIEVDSDGYVTKVVGAVSMAVTSDDEVRSVGTYTIHTVGGNRYTYDSDTVFVLIDMIDESVEVGSAADLMEQDDDEDEMTQIVVVSDDDGYLELVYILFSEKV